jgi:hypothetical protein
MICVVGDRDGESVPSSGGEGPSKIMNSGLGARPAPAACWLWLLDNRELISIYGRVKKDCSYVSASLYV